MLSFNSSNIVSKTRTIGRRMFLVSSFKAIVVVGILGRLAPLQINQFLKQQFHRNITEEYEATRGCNYTVKLG